MLFHYRDNLATETNYQQPLLELNHGLTMSYTSKWIVWISDRVPMATLLYNILLLTKRIILLDLWTAFLNQW